MIPMKKPKGKLFALLAIFAAVTLVAASGAFTSVQAERTAQVDVAADANAYLGLAPHSGPNGFYANSNAGANNNQLEINLGANTNDGGLGVNENALTTADDVFTITNQGTQEVEVYVVVSSNDNIVDFYQTGGADIEGSASAVPLAPGDSLDVGVEVDTRGYSGGSFSTAVTVHADATATPTP
jgi:hypothetical protein